MPFPKGKLIPARNRHVYLDNLMNPHPADPIQAAAELNEEKQAAEEKGAAALAAQQAAAPDPMEIDDGEEEQREVRLGF